MQTKQLNSDSRMNRQAYQLFILTACMVLLSTTDLFAQQGGSQNNLLPEIDPQDIEIRSEFTARFPGLRRQPILGFNPEPSIYQVDPNRQPFMESQEEVVANLPITDLSRPEAPPYRPLHYEPTSSLFARLGAGSYVSPKAEAWGIKNFSEKSYVSGRLDYHSTDGHLATRNSSFSFLNADAEYATKLNQNTSIKFSGGIENSFNRLFELENRQILPMNVPAGPKKEYFGLNTLISLDHHKNSIAGWNADLGVRRYNVDFIAGDIGGSAEESVFNVSFKKEWAGSKLHETFAVAASGKGGRYDISSQPGTQDWMTLRAGGEYHRLLDYSTQLTGAVDVVFASNTVEDKVYPGFNLEAKQWIQNDLTVTATLSGNPKLQTIEQLNHLNRFLNHQTQLRHTYTVEGTGEINFQYLEGSSLFAKVSYMTAQNYAYFMRDPLGTGSTPDPEGYYTIGYMNANKVKGAVGATHQLVPEKLWIDAEAYIQNPRLNNGDEIPFEESWGLKSGLSVKLFQKLRMEGWADYVSERNTLSSGTLEGFLLLGGQIDIQLTERFGVYARMLNLLNQEYEIWDGYQERPFQAYGGITVKLN